MRTPSARGLLCLLACSALALLAACDDGDSSPPPASLVQPFGPRMRPGENCLGCHADKPVRSDSTGPSGQKAPTFTAAGTIYAGPSSKEGLAGVRVIFAGKDGGEVVLTSNEVGNFYTDLPILKSPGPRVELQGRSAQMQSALPDIAACNACHDNPPVGGAPGRIYVP